jgi:3D (Asp-Asp-Asp) domain-containing protein
MALLMRSLRFAALWVWAETGIISVRAGYNWFVNFCYELIIIFRSEIAVNIILSVALAVSTAFPSVTFCAVPPRDVRINAVETIAETSFVQCSAAAAAASAILNRSSKIESVFNVSCTAYTTELTDDKITATGTVAKVGTVAVDPKLIPYGTKMYIEAEDGSWVYGYAVAEDCGGGIKGNKIDLFFDTYDECIKFGVRKAVVYIVES